LSCWRNALARLKSLGFAPGVVYDIGAYRGGWARVASEVFPSAKFVLFEANADHAGALAALGHRHVIAALGAEDGGRRPFHVPRAGDVTGASLYVEKTTHYAAANVDMRAVETVRLDTLVARERLPLSEKVYTWWSYRAADWTAGDRGRRLDHIWVSRALKDQISDFAILRDARGWDRPSDHVPVTVTLEV